MIRCIILHSILLAEILKYTQITRLVWWEWCRNPKAQTFRAHQKDTTLPQRNQPTIPPKERCRLSSEAPGSLPHRHSFGSSRNFLQRTSAETSCSKRRPITKHFQISEFEFGLRCTAGLLPRAIAFHDLCKQIVWCYQGAPYHGSLLRWGHTVVCVCPNISTGQFEAVTAIQLCVDDTRNWMTNDKLLLNDDKTEFLMISNKQQLAKVNIDHILIGDRVIRPKGVVKNLGTWLDSTRLMNSHVNNTCSNALYYLYNIRKIRKYFSRRSTETLISAFVSSPVDYSNSLLYCLPAYQLNKLQRVQNAAARLIFQESKYCHIRPLLYNLHWLLVKFRFDFKILLV